jgi:hypothetical protein
MTISKENSHKKHSNPNFGIENYILYPMKCVFRAAKEIPAVVSFYQNRHGTTGKL